MTNRSTLTEQIIQAFRDHGFATAIGVWFTLIAGLATAVTRKAFTNEALLHKLEQELAEERARVEKRRDDDRRVDHVFVIDANGRRISWTDVSRIDENEMRELMQEIVNRLYTFHLEADDPKLQATIERWMGAAMKWDEPEIDRRMISGSLEEPRTDHHQTRRD